MSNAGYVEVDILGMKELVFNLRMIKDVVAQDRIQNNAMEKALRPVRDRAIANVAVDKGDLRETIIISKAITRSQEKRSDRNKMYVGSYWPTAHLVEWGTGPRITKVREKQILASGGNVFGKMVDSGSMPAQPFMGPAWMAERQNVIRIFGEEMWKALKRTAARLSKQAKAGKLSSSGRRALGLA